LCSRVQGHERRCTCTCAWLYRVRRGRGWTNSCRIACRYRTSVCSAIAQSRHRDRTGCSTDTLTAARRRIACDR
jgi:hypothetical protein